MSPHVLLIDNYDSFTYNLYQYLCELGALVTVVRNDVTSVEEVRSLAPDFIVISPGPGVPTQSAEYVLGEGFAELQVGSGGAAFDFGGFGGFGAGFGDFGGFGDQTGGPNGPAGSGLSNLGTTLAANRVPLAFLFLTLEALLLAAAAAWVWARNTPADAVPDEVLSP